MRVFPTPTTKYFHRTLITLALASVTLLSACQSIHSDIQTNTPPDQSHIKHANEHSDALNYLSHATRHQLDNGLTVIIKEDRRAPVVMTQIWYRVGAVDEPVGKGGMSHFLEHLMFKDTPSISGDEFDKLISYHGGNNNAYTNPDVTVYHEILPSNYYPLALELEANRMKNVLFDGEQIERERQVILEERRLRTDDDPMSRVWERFFAFVYGDTPRGRPVIGSSADINNITLDDLKGWYQTWYNPSNATVVLVGDVNTSDALAQVEKYFGNIPAAPAPAPARDYAQFLHPDHLGMGTTKPSDNKNRHLNIEEQVYVPSVVLTWQAPSVSSLRHDGKTLREMYALALFADVLAGGASSRIEKNLVRRGDVVSSAGAGYNGMSYGDTLFYLYATPKAGVSPDAARDALLAEVQKTLDSEISDAELQRSHVALKSSIIMSADGIGAQADTLGRLHYLGLPFDFTQTAMQLRQDIRVEEIKAAAKKYLSGDRMYSFYVVPKLVDTADTQNSPAQ